MKVNYVILLVIFVSMLSCGRKAPKNDNKIANDTLVYAYKTIKEKAPDCGNKPDSSCTVAKITYPVFTDQQALNDTITQRLLIAYSDSDGKPKSNLQQQAKSFIKFYVDDTSRNTDHPEAIYTLESSATVIRQDSSLSTIQVDRYSYAGAAHGSEYTGFINWNTKENKSINLDDVLLPGYAEKLAPLAQKIYQTQDTMSLKNNTYDMVKDGKLILTHNFLITPIGLSFLYNEYELQPYSEGPTTILIPYVQIKSLLRPNTVISQYIKK